MKQLKHYFGIIVLAAIAVSFLWLAPGKFLAPATVPLLMLIMFLSCLKINPRLIITEVKKKSWRYGVLLALVFLLPPLVAFAFRPLLSPLVYIGLLIVAAAPAGIATVMIADILGGEPSEALVMTTVAHLVSPLVTPALVWIFGHTVIEISFGAIALSMLKLVIVPFALAQIVRLARWEKSFLPYATPLNILLLVLIILGIVSPAVPLVFANAAEAVRLALVILTILVLEGSISIWFGRTKREDITWSVIDIFKNYTVPAVIAGALFGPLATLGAVVYGIMNSLASVPLQWWAQHKKK